MSSVSALIKHSNASKNGQAPVYIRYSHQGRSVLFPTGIKIHPEYWQYDSNPQNPISKRYGSGYEVLNDIFRDKINLVFKMLRDSPSQGVESISSRLQNNQNSEESETTLLDVLQTFLGHQANVLRPNTIKGYIDLKSKIEGVSPSAGIKCIDLEFYNMFVTHLAKSKLANSSIGKLIKNLKAVLRWAENCGTVVSTDYRKFKVFKPKKPITYLTQVELKAIIDLNLASNLKLDRVRDLFIIQCRTGLRISDLKRLDQSHIVDGFIQMEAYKNHNQLMIRITPLVDRVLKKYGYILPKLSEQRYNTYIKELCHHAGITTPTDNLRLPSGKVSKVPKYKLISNHTAVRTFITHCAERGVSPKVTSQITGKTVRVILDHYYGTDQETIDRDMMNAFGNEL